MNRFSGYYSDRRGDGFEEDLQKKYQHIFLQKLKQHVNVRVVVECVARAGFRLQGFVTNENLEFHYDVYSNRRKLCYISKGWKDPGIRIGEMMALDRTTLDFKRRMQRIFDVCAKNLVSVGIVETTSQSVTLVFQLGIFNHGFNEYVFKQAIDVMDETMDAVYAICVPS